MSLLLAGPRPGDLPIEQASKLITVPSALLSLADEVIE
jgi:hypothetical protein